uniref:Mediator of RNA polymerase II transcription subunit 20 n=1 Tax=Schistocephalus solidus TaxID=70667 RepID=A0A183TCW3_SCHSO
LMNFDLSIVWLKNAQSFVKAFTVDASYLQHAKLGKMPDFRVRFVPLSPHVKMAHYLEHLLVSDGRFEIVGEVTLGLVCFRIKVTQSRKQILLK